MTKTIKRIAIITLIALLILGMGILESGRIEQLGM